MAQFIGGWLPDKPDFRDLKFVPHPTLTEAALPNKFDASLKPAEPAIWNQGEIGSCTGHGLAHVLWVDQVKQGKVPVMPSRLFVYYNERVIEKTVRSDAGAEIRDGIKAVASKGFADETLWPYDITKFAKKPPVKAYKDAKGRLAVKYMSVNQTEHALKAAIFSEYPVVFGFSCYSSLESDEVAKTGKVPMPSRTESQIGGHCVTLVGYDDSTRLFKFRNSWGSEWGDKGYGYLPYEYILNPDLASDFWVIEAIS